MAVNADLFCIVEDNTPIRKLFGTIVKKSGYQIIEYGDGASALAGIKENKPGTIILDILLPDANGTDLIKDIRQIEDMDTVPIIAVTGFAQTQDKETFENLGFDGYISKPINTSSFMEEVKKITHK